MMWRNGNSYPHWNLNSDPTVVQLIASRYTDYAIPEKLKIIGPGANPLRNMGHYTQK
jgi:hypothetical protein